MYAVNLIAGVTWYTTAMHRLFTHWLPVLLWMALIAALSSIPALQSNLPPVWDLAARKFAHATEYGVLALLVQRAHGLRTPYGLLLTVAWCVAYAASDEFHQSFVLGRHGAALDVLVDSFGATIAAGFSARRGERFDS